MKALFLSLFLCLGCTVFASNLSVSKNIELTLDKVQFKELKVEKNSSIAFEFHYTTKEWLYDNAPFIWRLRAFA